MVHNIITELKNWYGLVTLMFGGNQGAKGGLNLIQVLVDRTTKDSRAQQKDLAKHSKPTKAIACTLKKGEEVTSETERS